MNKLGAQVQRVSKWIAVLACALLCIAWAASMRRQFGMEASSTTSVVVESGFAVIVRAELASDDTRREFASYSYPDLLLPKTVGDRTLVATFVPLWIPLAVLALPTALMFLPQRRKPYAECRKCGCPLSRGVRGVCPECGLRIRSGRRRRALRRVLKWGAVSACVLVAALWIVSRRGVFGVDAPPVCRLVVENGELYGLWSDAPSAQDVTYGFLGRSDVRMLVWALVGPKLSSACIPLWFPLGMFAALALSLFALDRRGPARAGERRPAKWLGLLLCFLFCAAWVFSILQSAACEYAGSYALALEKGCIVIAWYPQYFSLGLPDDWWIRPTDEPVCWSYQGRAYYDSSLMPFSILSGSSRTVPLWMPFLIALLPTALLFWVDRRWPWPLNHCQTCGYNLTGNVSGRCPECGAAVETSCEQLPDDDQTGAGRFSRRCRVQA